MMKTTLATLGLAVTTMTGAAVAQDLPMSGFISLGAVQSTNENDNFDTDYNPWRGLDFGAAVSFDLSGGKSVDLELRNFLQGDAYEPSYYLASGRLATAGYNVNNGTLGYGGYAGLYTINSWDGEGVDTNMILGAKLSYALSDKLSLKAQLGTLSHVTGYYEMGRVNFGTVSASYQVSDALRLAATVGGIGGQVGDDSDETITARSFSVEAAYNLTGPVEVYANVSGYDTGDADWGKGNTVGLGFKINFGGKSLANGAVADLTPLSYMRMGGNW